MVLISGRLAARAVLDTPAMTELSEAPQEQRRAARVAGAPRLARRSTGPARITARRPRPPATLTAAYERCRQLNRQHGTSYYLATRLLPGLETPARARALRLRPVRRRDRG